MFVAFEPDDYLHSLIEVRKSDARRLFRRAIYNDYPLRGPRGQAACAYCGQWHGKLTIDHIIPKSRGGPHFARWNLAPACERSNPNTCLLYTSPSPRDGLLSRMPSSA